MFWTTYLEYDDGRVTEYVGVIQLLHLSVVHQDPHKYRGRSHDEHEAAAKLEESTEISTAAVSAKRSVYYSLKFFETNSTPLPLRSDRLSLFTAGQLLVRQLIVDRPVVPKRAIKDHYGPAKVQNGEADGVSGRKMRKYTR